jgi:hypothetical protein
MLKVIVEEVYYQPNAKDRRGKVVGACEPNPPVATRFSQFRQFV